jgi:hypothetical protein
MKKIITLLITLLLISLAACGSEPAPIESEPAVRDAGNEPVPEPAPVVEEVAPEPAEPTISEEYADLTTAEDTFNEIDKAIEVLE